MCRNFTGAQRHLETTVNSSVKLAQNHSNHSPQGPIIYYDEVSDIKSVYSN